jgi:hypothetical protein
MGRVDDFFGDLVADECLSNNEIRSGPLLGICFDIFIGVSFIYDAFVF